MAYLVDAHSDMLNDLLSRLQAGEKDVLKNRWLPGMREGGINLRVTALYSDPVWLPEMALRRALDMTAALVEELDGCPEAMLCKSYQDILQAEEQGKTGFILGMEGAEPLGADLRLLRVFYDLGLRVLGLTHARRNALADGAPFFPVRSGQVGGLSGVGLAMVEKAQDLGMVIDLSHLNEQGFWDVLDLAKPPLIASHSNARVVHDHPRNLTDKQIKALSDQGGVMGLNVDRFIVGGADLEKAYTHLDHLVKMGGEEHVGLGPDFCDYLLDLLSPVERAQVPEGGGLPVRDLACDRDMARVAGDLAERGYKSRTIELILGLNFKRVFQEVFKK